MRAWLAALVLLVAAGRAFAADIVLLTGNTGGVYYPMGQIGRASCRERV